MTPVLANFVSNFGQFVVNCLAVAGGAAGHGFREGDGHPRARPDGTRLAEGGPGGKLPGVVLPASYTFQSTDNGIHTFPAGVTLITPGAQTLTAIDTANGSITGGAIVTVSAPPAPPPGGSATGPTVQSRQQVVLMDRLFASTNGKESWIILPRPKRGSSWADLFHGIGSVELN